MALTKESMADKIVTKLKVLNPAISEPQLKPFWEAIAEGVIEELTENGVIKPGTFKDGTGADITGEGVIE